MIVIVRMNATISTEQRTGVIIEVSMTTIGALMKHSIGSRNTNFVWVVETTQRVLDNGLCQFLFCSSSVTDKEKKESNKKCVTDKGLEQCHKRCHVATQQPYKTKSKYCQQCETVVGHHDDKLVSSHLSHWVLPSCCCLYTIQDLVLSKDYEPHLDNRPIIMMPYNSLALLAILALGFIWLLSGYMTSFVTLLQIFVSHALFIGFFFLFICYTTGMEEKLTQTIIWNPLSSFSYPNEVHVSRSNRVLHQCTYYCHRNFDNTCPLLCGDHCIHLNCNNHHHPDLFPPPEIPHRSASLPLHSTLASLSFLQQYTSFDQHPYGLLHAITHSQHTHCPSTCLSGSHHTDQVDGAHLSFNELVDRLKDYIAKCQANNRCRHRLANRHDIHQRVHQDARPPPVRSLPHVGSHLPSLSSSSILQTVLEWLDLWKEETRGDSSEKEETLVPSSSEGSPVRSQPPECSQFRPLITMTCSSCHYTSELHRTGRSNSGYRHFIHHLDLYLGLQFLLLEQTPSISI